MGRARRKKNRQVLPEAAPRGLDKKDLYNAAAGSGESRHQVNSLLGMDWGDDMGDDDEVPGAGQSKQTARPASQMAQRSRPLSRYACRGSPPTVFPQVLELIVLIVQPLHCRMRKRSVACDLPKTQIFGHSTAHSTR